MTIRSTKALEARQFEAYLHLLGRQGPHHLVDNGELVDVCFAGKQRLPIGKLSHYAPESPQVDRLPVPVLGQQQLRSAIPAGSDVVGQRQVRVPFARATEVADAQSVIGRVDEQILWLYVTVDHAVPVAMLERTRELERHNSYVFSAYAVGVRVHDVHHGHLDELEDDVNSPLSSKRFPHLHDVLVLQIPEELDFAQRNLPRVLVVLIGRLKLLDSNELTCFLVLALVDGAVSAVANGLKPLILLHRPRVCP
mmetsp:Transcript_86471/g.242022  ORF Transcript_86471/g.242022 Transcript_86471/m.242022 type:complete len:252 (+) Transcript_86471:839-1594(+)